MYICIPVLYITGWHTCIVHIYLSQHIRGFFLGLMLRDVSIREVNVLVSFATVYQKLWKTL